jgi:hypothetical protein
MSDLRQKDVYWNVYSTSHGTAHLAVLMDIRDELKILNRLLGCSNFVAIPKVLRGIRANTTRRRPRVDRAALHRKAVRRSRQAAA